MSPRGRPVRLGRELSQVLGLLWGALLLAPCPCSDSSFGPLRGAWSPRECRGGGGSLIPPLGLGGARASLSPGQHLWGPCGHPSTPLSQAHLPHLRPAASHALCWGYTLYPPFSGRGSRQRGGTCVRAAWPDGPAAVLLQGGHRACGGLRVVAGPTVGTAASLPLVLSFPGSLARLGAAGAPSVLVGGRG